MDTDNDGIVDPGEQIDFDGQLQDAGSIFAMVRMPAPADAIMNLIGFDPR